MKLRKIIYKPIIIGDIFLGLFFGGIFGMAFYGTLNYFGHEEATPVIYVSFLMIILSIVNAIKRKRK